MYGVVKAIASYRGRTQPAIREHFPLMHFLMDVEEPIYGEPYAVPSTVAYWC